MGSSFGGIFRFTTWGESHGPALGVVVEGCPAGIQLTVDDIQLQLDRRRVGQSKVTSPRGEKDRAEILSGVFEGMTTGAPISMITYNADADSTKYDIIRDMYRPGHADYTYSMKYGIRDHRGGGRHRPQDPGDAGVRGVRLRSGAGRHRDGNVRPRPDRAEHRPLP